MDDFLLKPINEFAALAERSPIAASLVLALVVVLGVGALMRTFFKQRATHLKDIHGLEIERLRGELAAERSKNERATDNDTLERIPQLLKLMFEQAGATVAPQFHILAESLHQLVNEQKRSNDLSETNIRQHDIRQRELVTINKQGFNDLGIRINDKIDDMVKQVSGMRDDVIKSLGEQISEMVSEVKQEIGKLPDATAQAVATLLDQHKKDIDAQLKTILEEIRAAQTQPIQPPTEEKPPDDH